MNTSEWSDQYQAHLDNPPEAGTVLQTLTNEPARLDIEIQDGKPPFLYGRAFVPCIVGEPVGWYLQPMGTKQAHGWKCILLPKAREECLRRCGLKESTIPVKSLRIIRKSKSGSSLLCEVAEYWSEPESVSTESVEAFPESVPGQPEELGKTIEVKVSSKIELASDAVVEETDEEVAEILGAFVEAADLVAKDDEAAFDVHSGLKENS